MTRRTLSLLALPTFFATRASAQVQSAPADPYTTFDGDGTAHIKRSIPVPKTISPEAQELMISGRWMPQSGTKERDAFMEKMQAVYPTDVEATTVAGVKAWRVNPSRLTPNRSEARRVGK